MNSVAALDPSPVRPALCFEDVNLDATELHDEPAPHFTLCLVLQGEARLSHRIDDRWHTDWLRPGMFARVQVQLGVREQAAWVPEAAIVPRGQEFATVGHGHAAEFEAAHGLTDRAGNGLRVDAEAA